MSEVNAQVQRFSAVMNIGTVTANTTKDVTFNVTASTTTPGAVADVATTVSGHAQPGDSPLVFPTATNSSGVSFGEAFVSAQGVITVRVANSTTANVAAGTAVTVHGILFKGRGSI